MKRIAFIINVKNFRPSSGHGIFMKGAVETFQRHGHFIDIICDGDPEENFLENYQVNIYTPPKHLRTSYVKHCNLFEFEDSFNYEKCINFRTALTTALSNHVYDLIICNDTESAFVCYQMQLHNNIAIATYAHECASINPELKSGVFKNCYYDLIDKMMFWPEMQTLIQTEQNQEKLTERFQTPTNTKVQYYPLTDSTDLQINTRDGLLFIGRHEERKNPAEFIKVLKGIKEKYDVELKANIMTRTSHVKKWKADFESIGHSNYEIVADVVGYEKERIIQSSKVAFMPYKNESFGIAVLEALRWMPTVVISKFNWHYNFKNFKNYIATDTANLVDVIWNAYNNGGANQTEVEKEFDEYQLKYETALLSHFKDFARSNSSEPRSRLYLKLKEKKGEWLSLEEYFSTENSKAVIYLTSDIESIYTNLSWYQILHTNKSTYLGIADEAGNVVMKEISAQKTQLSSFFE